MQRLVFSNDMETVDSSWINCGNRTTERSHSGKYASKVDKNANFSVGKYIPMDSVPYKRNVLIRASGWFFMPAKENNAFFAISFVGNDQSINYNPYQLNGFTNHFGQWEYHTFELQMPKLSALKEQFVNKRVEFYLYNDSEIPCYIDDLKIEFIEFKEMERPLDLSWE